MTSSETSQIDRLQQTIQALEVQRVVLGDAVVQASIEALRNQIAELDRSEERVAQQRKLATILFADIVGHTKLVQDLDPEVNLEIIDGALVRLAGVVESYGGHIARFQGDGFKAIFGAPAAHESDPERAVRAGLGIITAAQNYDRKLQAERNLTGFTVRVGIDTGLAIVGGGTEAEDTIGGLVVNLAARLESAAPPGGLLISHHTYQHVRGIFDVEVQEPVLAKGFPEPVPVYLVKRSKPHAFRRGTRGVEGLETKMIGREGDLLALQAAYRTAAGENQTTVVTIVGEAGIGKSRLLFEFEQWLKLQREPVQRFRGRASQLTQGIPYYLMRDVLSAHFQILDSDPLDLVRRKLVAGLVELLPKEGEKGAHILGKWLGYDFGDSPFLQAIKEEPEQIKNRATLYLAKIFEVTGSESAIVILLEDVHWADGGSLDTVIDLAARRPQLPLLIVCLARPSLYERRPGWGGKMRTHTRLDLVHLSVADTSALVAEILRLVDPLPQVLLDLVSGRAEGNPFYAEELVKMLIDEGMIVTSVDSWHVAPEQLHGLNVPSTLTGVLQARLDRLTAAEKKTLQQASVIGRIFWDKALVSLPDAVNLALPVLQTKEFIFARGNSAFARTVEYIFKHALMRDVTYETVLLRLRRDYHGRIARWIEESASDRLGEYSGLIAEHYMLAEEYGRASAYWEWAGDTAFNSGEYSGACDAYELALELEPGRDPLQMAELERKLAATLPLQKRIDEAETLYRAALARLDGPPPTAVTYQWQSTRLNILLGLMDTLYFQQQPQAMVELKVQIRALLNEVGTFKQRSDYYSRLAQITHLRSRYRTTADSIPLARKALAYAQELGSAQLIARNQFQSGFFLLWHGDLNDAAVMLRQAMTTAAELGDPWLHIQCQVYQSILDRFQGNTIQVATHLPEVLESSHELGYVNYIGVGEANSAWLYYRAGEWQQAQAQAQAALGSWAEMRYPFQWLAHWPLLTIFSRQDRPLDAIAQARAMLDPGQQQLPDDVHDVLETAVTAWEASDEAAAQSHLQAAVELASQRGYI